MCVNYDLNSDEAESCANNYDTCIVDQDKACCDNGYGCIPNSSDASEGTCQPYAKSFETTFGDADSNVECVENDC